MHRDDIRKGMTVHIKEQGCHVVDQMDDAMPTLYVKMVCGKRYLASRCTLPGTRPIADQQCYIASLAQTISDTGEVPRVYPRTPGHRPNTTIKAIFACKQPKCRRYDIDFASPSQYEAACAACGFAAIWQRGYP